jgi:hypothetical protein
LWTRTPGWVPAFAGMTTEGGSQAYNRGDGWCLREPLPAANVLQLPRRVDVELFRE